MGAVTVGIHSGIGAKQRQLSGIHPVGILRKGLSPICVSSGAAVEVKPHLRKVLQVLLQGLGDRKSFGICPSYPPGAGNVQPDNTGVTPQTIPRRSRSPGQKPAHSAEEPPQLPGSPMSRPRGHQRMFLPQGKDFLQVDMKPEPLPRALGGTFHVCIYLLEIWEKSCMEGVSSPKRLPQGRGRVPILESVQEMCGCGTVWGHLGGWT